MNPSALFRGLVKQNIEDLYDDVERDPVEISH